jgi:lipopolysaccharide transport system permease protein
MGVEPSIGEGPVDSGAERKELPLPQRRIVLRARHGHRMPDLRDAWHYRELFWVLAERDIRIRYKQTFLGVAWAIIQPLFTMIVFTMISRVASISTDGVRPEVFYYCGMLPWLLFANSLASAGNSLVASQHLIAKVYFPRIVLPVASVITALVDFAIAFVVLLGLMVAYRVPVRPEIALLPIFVAIAFFAALGFGIGLSALSAQFRDVRHVAPFVIQVWFFCTPVLYSSTSVGHGYKRLLLGLNPMSGVVDGMRWCVLGRPRPGPELGLSLLVVVVVLLLSLAYFGRVERTLADDL